MELSPVSELWRWIYWSWRDFRVGRTYVGSEPLLLFGESLGDNLLCTVAAEEIFRRTKASVCILTPYPQLFEHHPAVAHTRLLSWGDVNSLRRLGKPLLQPTYNRLNFNSDTDTPPRHHIIADMCESVGIRGLVNLRPRLFLRDEEQQAGLVAERQICIMSSGLEALFPMLNKNWILDRYQEVVTGNKDRYTFLQIGTRHDPALEGAADLRGKLSLRESAAVLSQSLAFVGQVGFLMHLARAVDCRSVIIYGGRERPDQSGYACNENLYNGPPCSPCWQRNNCDFDRICLSAIEVDDVVQALDRAVARHDEPLNVDTVTL